MPTPAAAALANDAVVHVRQVHHVVQLESAQLQEAPQDILKHEGAVIPDMRVVVDRRPHVYMRTSPTFCGTKFSIFPVNVLCS